MNNLRRASGSKPRKQVIRRKVGGNKSRTKLSVAKTHSHKRVRNTVVISDEIKFIFERTLPTLKQTEAFLQGIKYGILKSLEFIFLLLKSAGF